MVGACMLRRHLLGLDCGAMSKPDKFDMSSVLQRGVRQRPAVGLKGAFPVLPGFAQRYFRSF